MTRRLPPAQLLAAMARVAEGHLVCLTAGEAAVAHTGTAVSDLGGRRRGELQGACQDLGIRSVTHGGLPDAGLGAVPARIDETLEGTADSVATTLVFTVWWSDPHPDHQAAGQAAARLAARRGIPVAGFPIWAPHWKDPSAVLRDKAVVLTPDAGSRAARQAALARYASQTEPLADGLEAVLPAALLRWTTEIAIRP
jgi:LmbE family N-acetylglucosaminyl deacetylase